MTPKFYVVGGAVRDVLLGIEPTDIDYLVVGATPEWMIENGYTKVGADFPVFLKDGEEYALARTERKTGKGYHGFTANWAPDITIEEDLQRRDLTINSMAVALEDWPEVMRIMAGPWPSQNPEAVLDKFVIGGTMDVFKQRIIANSGAFIEDPVRVFRAVRFAVTLPTENAGFWTIEDKTMAQMRHMVASADFNSLTKERVVQEVMKTASKCKSPEQFARFLRILNNLDAVNTVFSEFGVLFAPNSSDEGVSQEEAVGILMLSRRGSVVDAAEALKQLKYPNSAIVFATTLAHLHDEYIVNDTFVSGDRLLATMSKINHNHYDAVMNFMMVNGMFNGKPWLLTSIQYARSVWKDTGIKDLTDDQQESLSGKAIGLAIWGVKLKRLNHFVAKREEAKKLDEELVQFEVETQ